MSDTKDADRRDPFGRMIVLGMLVERFASLESQLRRTAWLLLNPDPIAAHVFTAQASAAELITLSERVITESRRKGAPRGTPELEQALKRARNIFNERNNLLHNVHMPDSEVWKYRRHEERPEVISASQADLARLDWEVIFVMNSLHDHRPEPPYDDVPHY